MSCRTCNGTGGAERFHLQLNANAVAVQGCPRCRPTHMDVFYVPDQQVAPPAYEDIADHQLPENVPRRRRPANNGNGSGTHPETQTLNLDNISRVTRGDRVELKFNGTWIRYEVIDHAIMQRTVEMSPEGPELDSGRRPFNYAQLIEREARIIFRFQRDRDLWEQRIEVPQDFPREDSSNWKLFMETIRLCYVESVSSLKATPGYISNLVKKSLEMGAQLLKKSADLLKDTALFQSIVYFGWKRREIDDRLNAGEIMEEEHRELVEHYKIAVRRTAGMGGALVGAVGAVGIRAALMAYYGVTSAVAAVEVMCTSSPALAALVAAIGGPTAFVAIGGLALVVGAGCAGVYLHNKLAAP